jgi:hypothetical protein
LDVAPEEIAPIVRPLPFDHGHLLSAGGFRSAPRVADKSVGAAEVMKAPVVTLGADGRVRRTDIPDGAIAAILGEHGGDGVVMPSAVGPLVLMQGQYRQGAAAYLIEGERPRLLWRRASEIDPEINDATLSPDGCSVAFVPASSGAGGPVTVLTFCAR